MLVIIDSDIFIRAMQHGDVVCRQVLAVCFKGGCTPLMASPLYYKYDAAVKRCVVFESHLLDKRQTQEFFNDYCSVCQWVACHENWDIEQELNDDVCIHDLAEAGKAEYIISSVKAEDTNLPFIRPEDFVKIDSVWSYVEKTWQ